MLERVAIASVLEEEHAASTVSVPVILLVAGEVFFVKCQVALVSVQIALVMVIAMQLYKRARVTKAGPVLAANYQTVLGLQTALVEEFATKHLILQYASNASQAGWVLIVINLASMVSKCQ